MTSKGDTSVDAPNPIDIARADAIFNRIDQYTPLGSVQFFGDQRNKMLQTLNPAVQYNQNQQLLSDIGTQNMALSRQADMKGGSLPSLTPALNPTAQQEFFGLPANLQSGYDPAIQPPDVPDFVGDYQPSADSFYEPTRNFNPELGPTFWETMGDGRQVHPLLQDKAGANPNPTPAPQPQSPQAGQPGLMNNVKGGSSPLTAATGGGGMPANNQPIMAQAQQPQMSTGLQAPQMSTGLIDPSQMGGQMPQTPSDYASAFRQPRMMQGQGLQQMMAQGASQGGSGGLFGGSVGGLINPETFGQIGSLDQLSDFDIDRGRVEQATFDRASSLLNPQFDQQEQRMVADLRARGIPRNSEAFEREMANFRRSKGETFGRLGMDSVLAGGGEQSRLFGLSSALGDRSQNAIGQMFGMGQQLAQQDLMTQMQNANISQANRATQFNELAALLGMQQVAQPGLQNFFAPGQTDAASGFAIQNQANMANANSAAAQKGGQMDAAAGLLGAAILASDRKVKKNIERVGTINGYPWYKFEYIWGGESMGVMSDEVPEDFVVKHPDGYDMVDYRKVFSCPA